MGIVYIQDCSLSRNSSLVMILKSTSFNIPYIHPSSVLLRHNQCRRLVASGIRMCSLAPSSAVPLEQPGGKMVVELVGAFNDLAERMKLEAFSTSSSHILFKSLKLSIPILLALPVAIDGRSPLSRALSVAVILADLQMDAEVISASILREVLEAGHVSINEVRGRIGSGTAHLLLESFRVKNIPSKVDDLDDETSAALRKFCLTYYDVRAIILDLALKLDAMRHLDHLPRYKQQILSLEVMKIHAPLSHAVGANLLSLELEDLSFRYLFPYSYLYLDTWLSSHEAGNKPLLDIYKDHLLHSLRSDPLLLSMVDDIFVTGRYKSRYSTMKKLLKDGRKPEEINDILGLRIILTPVDGLNISEMGIKACYRAREIICSLWKEIPNRLKDYISHPKANGYKSLHMAVDASDSGSTLLMEIQIRTMEMDVQAAGGASSHSLYKSGLTDPEEAKRLKAIMMATAELAALRLKDLPSSKDKSIEIECRDRVFSLLDKNGDGKISLEELKDVMEELGAQGEDARELMKLLDSNRDGSLSSDEFDKFQKQVGLMRNIEERDDEYKNALEVKLQLPDNCSNSNIETESGQSS
ncbi:probable GTP diphosphokinase CRSH, chloroplastic [Impatiens glandulifera]|uniref:probable GTP diphosphokinase CRSH, chloroplastic n=1 Tax=Impatiens glandulifera TaxID=253017 RepID=UPI001FB12D1A|nr:probable GTP diphosphokinase CRSH, chloroplastic [Impatiens glandulifera]XP_047327455.1 probable GTP diphosphokinase CRSH, chloroplastic [Impatiens glandulifera]